MPLGCASNSWLEALDHKLVAGGLREHFTVLEASDTVENPKPAPDMYAAAARALGQRPEDCLALEDSGTGARAARDALRLTNDPAAWALGDAAYWAARAAAQAARALGDERTADYTDGVADDLVALAESAGHVIRR